MSKKKVLFLIHTLQVGGAEKTLVELVNHLDKHKYDITIMTVVNTGAFRQKLNPNIHYKTIFDISFLEKIRNTHRSSQDNQIDTSGNLLANMSPTKKILSKFYKLFWRYINCQKIYNQFVKDDYDVEIAFLEGVAAKIIANSTNEKAKKYAWIHVDVLNERKTEAFFKNREDEIKHYQTFDKIIGVSDYVIKQASIKYKLSKNRTLIKYNPVDVANIQHLAKQKINIPKHTFTLVTVGRLAKQKGFDRLLKVINKINADNIDIELWILGVGPEENYLKKYISDNNLTNVKMLGYQSNPYPYIKSADLFVCSSRAEGFSTVVSEAIILGKPIVTTDCSGMREMLGTDSQYGLICPNNEEALYQALKSMITNELLRKHYIKTVKKRQKFFNIDTRIKDIEELIDA